MDKGWVWKIARGTKADEVEVKDEIENIKAVLFKKTSGMDEIQIKRRKESIEVLCIWMK